MQLGLVPAFAGRVSGLEAGPRVQHRLVGATGPEVGVGQEGGEDVLEHPGAGLGRELGPGLDLRDRYVDVTGAADGPAAVGAHEWQQHLEPAPLRQIDALVAALAAPSPASWRSTAIKPENQCANVWA